MERIRVLHILNSLGAGGIETFIINIYRNINKEMIQFDFLIQSSGEQFYEQEISSLGGNIYRITPRSKSIGRNIKELNLFFKESAANYNTVHFHVSSLSDITAMVIARRYKIRNRVIHSHNVKAGGSKLHTYLHYVNKNLLSFLGTDFFACSEDAGKWMFNTKVLKSNKFKIINNAIDIAKFEYKTEARISIRKELGIDDSSVVLGHIGRFHPQKNHIFLIKVFKEVVDINSNSYLLLVGSGALQKDIEKIVREENLTDKVLFLGLRKDTSRILSALDCFVFPSLYEGLGIVLIEAQANGVPIIASSNNIPESVKINNNFQFLKLEDSLVTWKENILTFSNKDRVNARLSIRNAGYDLEEVSKDLESFYLSAN